MKTIFPLTQILVIVVWTGAGLVHAGDWPQILGPNRNGVAVDETLPDRFPDGGPKVLWERPVGSGVAGVAVAGDVAVLFHREDNEDLVEAMNTADGKVRWTARFPTSFQASIDTAGSGPRCVPVIHKDAIYLYSAGGDLHAVSLKDGAKRWSRPALKELKGQEGYFGCGSTPLVEGDRLIVNVGGRGAGVVAFALADGKPVWKSVEDSASYSSPVAVTRDGVRHVIVISRLNAQSLDPATGAVRWQFPFGQRGPTVNAASPVVLEEGVFLTASYGIGAVFAKFGRDSVKTVWSNDDTLSSQYSTPVVRDGYLYGVNGRDDGPPASLRCVEARTGRVQWTKEGFGTATLILAGGKLLLLKTDGTLVLADASPKAYRELGTATVLGREARALPALSQGRLYVRDQETLKCLDMAK